jgi:hypothetical protein
MIYMVLWVISGIACIVYAAKLRQAKPDYSACFWVIVFGPLSIIIVCDIFLDVKHRLGLSVCEVTPRNIAKAEKRRKKAIAKYKAKTTKKSTVSVSALVVIDENTETTITVVDKPRFVIRRTPEYWYSYVDSVEQVKQQLHDRLKKNGVTIDDVQYPYHSISKIIFS